jgi:hypothetical protein
VRYPPCFKPDWYTPLWTPQAMPEGSGVVSEVDRKWMGTRSAGSHLLAGNFPCQHFPLDVPTAQCCHCKGGVCNGATIRCLPQSLMQLMQSQVRRQHALMQSQARRQPALSHSLYEVLFYNSLAIQLCPWLRCPPTIVSSTIS